MYFVGRVFRSNVVCSNRSRWGLYNLRPTNWRFHVQSDHTQKKPTIKMSIEFKATKVKTPLLLHINWSLSWTCAPNFRPGGGRTFVQCLSKMCSRCAPWGMTWRRRQIINNINFIDITFYEWLFFFFKPLHWKWVTCVGIVVLQNWYSSQEILRFHEQCLCKQ